MVFFKLEFLHYFLEVIIVKRVLHARIPEEEFLIGLKPVDQGRLHDVGCHVDGPDLRGGYPLVAVLDVFDEHRELKTVRLSSSLVSHGDFVVLMIVQQGDGPVGPRLDQLLENPLEFIDLTGFIAVAVHEAEEVSQAPKHVLLFKSLVDHHDRLTDEFINVARGVKQYGLTNVCDGDKPLLALMCHHIEGVEELGHLCWATIPLHTENGHGLAEVLKSKEEI